MAGLFVYTLGLSNVTLRFLLVLLADSWGRPNSYDAWPETVLLATHRLWKQSATRHTYRVDGDRHASFYLVRIR
jgi:hypothetical protein